MILSSQTTRSAYAGAPLGCTTLYGVTTSGSTMVAVSSESSTNLRANSLWVWEEPGYSTSIASKILASSPGGPATTSGFLRRETNWASMMKKGRPPKWSP